MNNASVIIGFSVTPTHISAVRLSAEEFSVEQKIIRVLPPATLSHDAKKLLDVPTLVPIIREMLEHLGNPQFSDPVYLSIGTPILTSREVVLQDAQSVRDALVDKALQSTLKDESPLLQSSLLRQHGNQTWVTYAVAGSQLVQDYCNAFYEAGVKLQGIDILPLTTLRALAGSGVLDAMLRKIGTDAYWGCFGTCGSQTWCTIWQGANLVHMNSFATPTDKKAWEDRILELTFLAGVDTLTLWLAWQEQDSQSGINPLKLNLKAPVRPAVLGPFYGPSQSQPSLPALGAALKTDILFPLGWNFLTDPAIEPLKTQYAAVPYTNYQPILPKLFFRVALTCLLFMILGSLALWAQNTHLHLFMSKREAQIRDLLADNARTNQTYEELFAWINKRTMEGIQLETLHVHASHQLALSGKAYDRKLIDRFLSLLSQKEPGDSLEIQQAERSITPLNTKPASFRFKFSGRVQSLQAAER